MARDISLYTKNILENSSLTVNGSDTGYPQTRLHDRHISLYWKYTDTAAQTFQVNQGTSSTAIDFLAIPTHNFNGKALHFERSSDGSSWVNVVSSFTASTASIATTFSTISKQYFRVTVEAITNPLCGEIFMACGHTFNVQIQPTLEDVDNVQWNRTVGGTERATKFGTVRRRRSYSMVLSTADRTSFRTAINDLDGYSKPFYVRDHEDNYFMAKFEAPPKESLLENPDYTQVDIDLIEQL